MSTQYSKGSEWRKWDLHIHTPKSRLNCKYNSSFKEVADKIKLEKLSVVGVTNYFIVEESEIAELQKELRNDVLLIPNFEFRINDKNKDGEYINIHILFNLETVKLKQVYEGLARIRLNNLSEPTEQYCTIENIRKYGADSITVSLDELLEQLNKDFKRSEDFLVVGVCRGYGGFRPDNKSRNIKIAIKIDKSSHFIFGNQDDTKFFLNISGDRDKDVEVPKSVIYCSDAHTIGDIGKKLTWIKADPTFEGLKQIIYEPELRVKIQKNDPTESETYATINSLSINFPKDLAIKDDSGEKSNFCLNGGYSLELSNNLTCVIGGRGSGKSTLAHILYNLWINNDFNKFTAISSPLVNLDMKPNPLKKVAECTDSDVPSQTEFFFQNEIELAAKNIDSMSNLIGLRLDKLSSIGSDYSLTTLKHRWIAMDDKNSDLITAYDEITRIDQDISKANEIINTLKKQTEIIKSDKYKGFQSNISTLTSQIADFKSYKINYDNLLTEIDSLSTSLIQLTWSSDQGKDILNSLNTTLNEHKSKLKNSYTEYANKYDANNFPDQLEAEKQELRTYLQTRGLSPENVQELAQANQNIKDIEEKIRLATLDKKPFEDIYNDKNNRINNCREAYFKYKDRVLEICVDLEEKLTGLSISEKEVKFGLLVDYKILKDNLINFVKLSLEDDTTLRADAIERLLFDSVDIDTDISNKNNIRDRLNESTIAEKHRQILQELINDDVFLEKFHLRLLKHAYDIGNIQIQTKLGPKLLKNTSFGERCGIVIAIILVAGTNPIVVDQPEDHLDGRFISDVLVPLLRNQKNNRQIILITRDANVVVGGDAELMHILEHTEKRTEILPSSIENIENREKYIWILDGGADAFSKREQKYNIDFLKKN